MSKLLLVIVALLVVVSMATTKIERKEIRKMTTVEFTKYGEALNMLKKIPSTINANDNASRYDDFVKIHVENYPTIHGCSPLLPWHRWFVRSFELALQEVANDTTIAIPYWDWTIDYKAINQSVILTKKYFGDEPSVAKTKKNCVTTGIAAHWKSRYDGFDDSDAPTCLTRLYSPFYMSNIPSPVLLHKIMNQSADFSSLRISVESGPHNNFHHGIGGDMAGDASPNDPMFWSHHSFIDKIWSDWQSINPTAGAIYNGGNCNTSCSTQILCHHQPSLLTDILVASPNVTVGHVMNISKLGYKYSASVGTKVAEVDDVTGEPIKLPQNPPMSQEDADAMNLNLQQANAAINGINSIIDSINKQNGF
eukprot:gene18882-22585_t